MRMRKMISDSKTKISLANGEAELILWIYLDEEKGGGYGGAIREALYGSESDTYGETIADAILRALEWAGVAGFSVPPTATLGEIRTALREAAAGADFDFDVRLYTSF